MIYNIFFFFLEIAPDHIIEEYNSYLKQKYKRLRMPLDGQWPPVHASDYVPLILSLSDFSNEQVLTSKINKILKGDIDHMSNNLINFEDIFKADENINSLLIQGSPGIGKTAFSLTVCKKWAAGKFFTQFKIVWLWALRDPQIEAFTSVDDLFFHDSTEISAAVVRQVKKSGGKDVLFVLDGWDELPDKFTKSRSSCFFLKLIEGNELPFSSVIVTSRNISSQRLFRQNLFWRTIDILGFSKDCVSEYIHKCFSKSPENEKQLLKLLKERPDIQSICYVPMNCSIVCYVFSCKQALPSTLTELYSLLAKNSLIRNVDLRGKASEDLTESHLPDEANNLYLSLCKLSYHGLSINRYTYSRNDIAAACEASTGVIVDIDKLGVLQAVNVFHSEGVSSSFHFLHTTVQEFMAANYIASLNQDELEIVIKSHFSAIGFKMVWQFYCGLLDGRPTDNKFIKHLQIEAQKAANIDSGFHDQFSYCSSDEELYFSTSDSESNSLSSGEEEIIEKEIMAEEIIEDEVLSSADSDLASCTESKACSAIRPHNAMTVIKSTGCTQIISKEVLIDSPNSEVAPSGSKPQVSASLSAITHFGPALETEDNLNPQGPPPTAIYAGHPLTSLSPLKTTGDNMIDNQILVTTGGLEGVPTTLSNASAVFFSKVNNYKEDKLQVLFTLKCIYETQDRLLCSSLNDILSSHLFFNQLSLSPGDINAIGFAIARSNRKWQLRLVNCDLDVNHLVMLCHHFLKSNCSGKLTRLYLNNNDLDHTSIIELVKMLPVLKPLQKLSLGSNSICDKSFENGGIPELIKHLYSLNHLNLASNKVTDVGLLQLTSSLIHHHLTHLDISYNSISPNGAKFLANIICNTTLQYLNVGGNPIEDIGILDLSPSLANSSLQFLDVSDTGMSDEGVIALATALHCNSSLHVLIMHSNNKITCEGMGILLDLCVQSNLSEIDLSFCRTGWSEDILVALGNSIPAFKTLRSLNISYNDLEEEGISALIRAISSGSHVTKLGLEGNSMSAHNLQHLGYMICENAVIKKISVSEDDLLYDTEEFDIFCDCMIASISLQVVEIHEVENEQELRKRFKQVNSQRETFDKNKIKLSYYNGNS